MALTDNFAAYSRWRTGLTTHIAALRNWLSGGDLLDAQTDARLQQMIEKLRDDQLTVAFVAEFSRGKSELINAIFFAGYRNRMLPSSAGRTTMCPTELFYDPARPPSIRLLPVQTRASHASVSEYKQYDDEWTDLPLNTRDAAQLQAAMRQVSEVLRVPPAEARRLGFALTVASDDDDAPDTGFRIEEDGLVEIPRWRHALINFPHPLLKQGLVILDTPGLNAIGTEPELTLNLLPNAHAVLFILAADTGVTQSDLAIWRDHIGTPGGSGKGRLVVLNKIDGLWDELRDETEINGEIARQIGRCADVLELPESQIYPVSAQKALVAKIHNDTALLARSQLLALEAALANELVPAKREIVRDATASEFFEIFGRTRHVIDGRLADMRDQLRELRGLRGKNKGVVEYMMGKVRHEKADFESGLQRYYAVRSVFSNLSNKLFSHLGIAALKERTHLTRDAMLGSSFSKGLSNAMSSYFTAVRASMMEAGGEIGEIQTMMEAIYKKFAVEHGLKLGSPTTFSLLRYEKEVARLEHWCNHNLNTTATLLKHEKRAVTQRFFDEVAVQVRRVFDHANRDAEIWLKSVMSPMETQVREHQVQLRRRLESIKRIHQATETLEDRIEELEHAETELTSQRQSLTALGEAMSAHLDAADAAVGIAA
jgi:hypothetical protein